MKLELVLFKSVGCFKGGDKLENYQAIFKNYIFKLGDDRDRYSDQYSAKDGSHIVYVWQGKTIDSISCRDNLYYKGINLIGLSIAEFQTIIGVEYDDMNISVVGNKIFYFFTDLNLYVEVNIRTKLVYCVYVYYPEDNECKEYN